MSTDDVENLFDDEDSVSELTEATAGVSPGSDRPTQSMPGSPSGNGPSSEQPPHRTQSDPKLAISAKDTPELREIKNLSRSLDEGAENSKDALKEETSPLPTPSPTKSTRIAGITHIPPCLVGRLELAKRAAATAEGIVEYATAEGIVEYATAEGIVEYATAEGIVEYATAEG
ncbi:MAG: hypothetical protein Q9193_003434, partial [Seirophora villosa]